MPAHQRQPSAAAIEALRLGVLEIKGQLVDSSNYTFLMKVTHDGTQFQAIYKPLEGEEPLSDFPHGLYRREVASYEMAEALGWPSVPETVVREDAPHGVGSLQRWIDADFAQHYFTFGATPELRPHLRAMALFDMVVNNADRKAGHVLLEPSGDIWGIDHGLTFHPEPKLRTVIWEFAGEPVPENLLSDLIGLADNIPISIQNLLSSEEQEALQGRIAAIAANPVFPEPVSQWQFPWPLV